MGSGLICCKVSEYVPINVAHVAILIPNAYLLQSMGFLVLARPYIYPGSVSYIQASDEGKPIIIHC